MPQTKGHAATASELECTAWILPAICRDSTKYARPIVPLLREFANGNMQLTYVVYGNEAAAGKESCVLYNLDAVHGVALSTNVRMYARDEGAWCKSNLRLIFSIGTFSACY